MLEQIVTNENVIDDADDQRHSGGAGRGAGALSPGGPLADGSSRPGSANLSPIASKGSSTSGGAGADDETRSLNRSSRLSPQGRKSFTDRYQKTSSPESSGRDCPQGARVCFQAIPNYYK
uniref:Uncharacterized protein n=1 Tax=Anopheles coluzzii TaxID=1518534 RepID=A0A8W7PJB6_ANOCL